MGLLDDIFGGLKKHDPMVPSSPLPPIRVQPSNPNPIFAISGFAKTIADEALTVDLGGGLTSPEPGTYWIIRHLVAYVCAQWLPIEYTCPVSGLFIVPSGAPIETAADGANFNPFSVGAGSYYAFPGLNMGARGIALPYDASQYQVGLQPAYIGAFLYESAAILKPGNFVVASGSSIRGVFSSRPGAVVASGPGPAGTGGGPGPGEASLGYMYGSVEIVRLDR